MTLRKTLGFVLLALLVVLLVLLIARRLVQLLFVQPQPVVFLP